MFTHLLCRQETSDPAKEGASSTFDAGRIVSKSSSMPCCSEGSASFPAEGGANLTQSRQTGLQLPRLLISPFATSAKQHHNHAVMLICMAKAAHSQLPLHINKVNSVLPHHALSPLELSTRSMQHIDLTSLSEQEKKRKRSSVPSIKPR